MSNPLNIYIIRHGETVSNIRQVVQGWSDSDLTEKGIYQAACTGTGLRGTEFQACYCGDLRRQMQTADVIIASSGNDIDMPRISDPDFREMYYGSYEAGPYLTMYQPLLDSFGLDISRIEELYEHLSCTQLFEQMANNDPEGTTEHFDEVARRMFRGLQRIIRENPEGGNVLLVSSSCAMADLIEFLFPEKTVQTLIRNCSVTIIRYQDGNLHLDGFDDVSFFEKGKAILESEGEN
jgi:probable phosphoglycerate mutase